MYPEVSLKRSLLCSLNNSLTTERAPTLSRHPKAILSFNNRTDCCGSESML